MALSRATRLAMACRIDPAVFSLQAGIEPDPWQAQLLRSNASRILLNCSRQSGKSTTMGTLALHEALYEPGSLTLIVSRSERQSGELFRKMLGVYRALGRPVSAEAEGALHLELESGSRIVALPGNEGTIRGFSGVNLLLLDEASKVRDDVYYTVRPMLAVSHGRLIAASTPFGTRGWWYDEWLDNLHAAKEGRRPDWETYEITAEQCPRITPEFLAEERRKMGDWWFSQEYGCQFLDSESSAFRQVDIDAALERDYEPWALADHLAHEDEDGGEEYEPWDLKRYMSE